MTEKPSNFAAICVLKSAENNPTSPSESKRQRSVTESFLIFQGRQVLQDVTSRETDNQLDPTVPTLVWFRIFPTFSPSCSIRFFLAEHANVDIETTWHMAQLAQFHLRASRSIQNQSNMQISSTWCYCSCDFLAKAMVEFKVETSFYIHSRLDLYLDFTWSSYGFSWNLPQPSSSAPSAWGGRWGSLELYEWHKVCG